MFFFSSRRRHTILQGDWSSDVCSSDLANVGSFSSATASNFSNARKRKTRRSRSRFPVLLILKIGRASCREGGEIAVVGGRLNKRGRRKRWLRWRRSREWKQVKWTYQQI